MRQSSTEEEPVEQQPRLQRRPPNLCYNRNFRRLGDLSEEEQRSVVALICNKVILSSGHNQCKEKPFRVLLCLLLPLARPSL